MKKLIAIAVSDLHLEEWKQFNKNGRRIDAHLSVWETLGLRCKKKNVPIYFLGDFYNNPKYITNRLLAESLPKLKETPCDVYGIDGNHDQDSGSTLDSQPNSYFNTLSKIFPQFHCLNFKSVNLGDVELHGVPYLSYNVGFEEYVKNIPLVKRKKNILLIHTDLPGAKDTNDVEVNSVQGISAQYSKLFKRFDLVLSGHIHKYQKLASNVYMVGAPLQQRRTDRNCEMGYLEIYDDMSVKFKTLKSPQFKTYTDTPDNDYDYWDKEITKKKKTKTVKKKKVAKSYTAIVKEYAKDKGISKVRTKKLIRLLK